MVLKFPMISQFPPSGRRFLCVFSRFSWRLCLLVWVRVPRRESGKVLLGLPLRSVRPGRCPRSRWPCRTWNPLSWSRRRRRKWPRCRWVARARRLRAPAKRPKPTGILTPRRRLSPVVQVRLCAKPNRRANPRRGISPSGGRWSASTTARRRWWGPKSSGSKPPAPTMTTGGSGKKTATRSAG